jgi:hypothetical protein
VDESQRLAQQQALLKAQEIAQQLNKVKAKIEKKIYEAEVEINDSPARVLLTKRATHDKVWDFLFFILCVFFFFLIFVLVLSWLFSFSRKPNARLRQEGDTSAKANQFQPMIENFICMDFLSSSSSSVCHSNPNRACPFFVQATCCRLCRKLRDGKEMDC